MRTARTRSADAKSQNNSGGRRGGGFLGNLSREAHSLIARLRQGAAEATPQKVGPAPEASPYSGALKGSAAGVRLMIRLRNTRATIFGEADLFHDPAWDILLDLYAAELEGRAVPLTSASIASMVPPSTAMRWIKLLAARGLVTNGYDDRPASRSTLVLTPKARSAIERFLDAVDAGIAQQQAPTVNPRP